MNTEDIKREKNLRNLVATAKVIISHQIGIIEGCSRINNKFLRLQISSDKYKVFKEYFEVIRKSGLPVGTARLLWDRASLRSKDKLLNELNLKYYDKIIEACWEIIDSYSNKNS